MNGIKPLARCMAVAFGGSMVLLSGSVYAQQATDQTTQKQERIEVTGSSIKRTDTETASPVTVLTRDDLEKLGVTSAAELLTKVSANNAGGFNVQQGVGSSLAGFSGASLRGLSSNRTLVLLNGRRLPGFATNSTAVDLNMIPFEALDRVEVLRDGASAVYGSDAIGGVINFITRKDFSGFVGSTRLESVKNGGNTNKVNFTFGGGDLAKDRYNGFMVIGYEKTKELKAADRSFAKTGILTGQFASLSQISGNTIPANIYDGTIGANGAFRPVGTFFSNPSAPGCNPSQSTYFDVTGPNDPSNDCIYDYTSRITLVPQSEKLSALGRGTFALDADNELFAEFSYAKTKTTYAISETPTGGFAPNDLVMLPSNPYYPTAYLNNPAFYNGAFGPGAPYNGPIGLFWRIRDGGRRTNEADVDQYRFNVGAKGLMAGWDYEAVLSNSKSKYDEKYTDGYYSRAGLQAQLNAGLLNPFGPNTAAALAPAKILASVRKATLDANELTAKMSRDVGQLAGGAMGLAVGVNFRNEKLTDESNPILASGDVIGGNTIPSTRGSRNSSGIFSELSLPFAKGWEGNIAARYDRYSGGVGGTFNPKVGIKWTPVSQLALRATASSGFRAPGITDLYGGTAIGSSATTYDPILCPTGVGTAGLCKNQFNINTVSNPNAKPEKAQTLTLGAVFEPSSQFSGTLDYYYIKIKGAIGEIGGNFVISQYQADPNGQYAQFIQRATGCGSPVCAITAVFSPIGNYTDIWTSGFDLSAKYKLPSTEAGKFEVLYDGTYVNRYDTKFGYGGAYIWGQGFSANTGADPLIRYRSVTQLRWERGPWNAAVAYNFQGGYKQTLVGATQTLEVGTYDTTDLQFGYTGIKNLTLTAGVRNITDRNPPFTISGNGVFQVGFDPGYADPRGRSYFLTASYAIK